MNIRSTHFILCCRCAACNQILVPSWRSWMPSFECCCVAPDADLVSRATIGSALRASASGKLHARCSRCPSLLAACHLHVYTIYTCCAVSHIDAWHGKTCYAMQQSNIANLACGDKHLFQTSSALTSFNSTKSARIVRSCLFSCKAFG